jgi:hypothetical protein
VNLSRNTQRASRKVLQLSVQLNVGSNQHVVQTANISQSGVAIVSDKAVHLDTGTPCQMTCQVKNEEISINCHVVRVYANKIALSFQDNDGFDQLLEAV